MSKNDKSTSNKPVFYAFGAIDRGDKTFWTQIGAAFKTKSGKGLNVSLDFLPPKGRFTLLPPNEKGEPVEPSTLNEIDANS